eukprot:gene17578-36111_t
MGLPVSFEFFPPKTPEGVEKLRAVRQQLYPLKPEFCSVTYGAGGSTQEGTFNTVRDILAESVPAASHFSCIGATKASVREQLATLKAMGVKRLVALRGDLPSGYGAGGEFHYASDLVAFIRAETGDDFHIEVACYPEIHPQARSPEADLQAFAAASLGQVHAATLFSGETVAVKLQYPGMAATIQSDLALLRLLLKGISLGPEALPNADIQARVMDNIAQTLTQELDYLHEAGQLQWFARHLQHPQLVLPTPVM